MASGALRSLLAALTHIEGFKIPHWVGARVKVEMADIAARGGHFEAVIQRDGRQLRGKDGLRLAVGLCVARLPWQGQGRGVGAGHEGAPVDGAWKVPSRVRFHQRRVPCTDR